MPSDNAMSWGLRSLADGFFRYYKPGVELYLRRQVVTNTAGDYSALGFQPSVTGAQSGFYDTLIDPPADVQDVPLRDIGLLGARLQFGSRIFIVSHTFVLAQMVQYGYTDDRLVWRDASVIGLYYGTRLYSISSITSETVGGMTTLWKIVGDFMEEPTSPSS